MTLQLFTWITLGWIGIAVAVHILLFRVTAPFGRHTRKDWGPVIPQRLGWLIMELPSLFIMIYFLLRGTHSREGYAWILFALWILHYINRALIFPFRIKARGKQMPLVIVLSAIFFNLVNAGLNGYYLAELAPAGKYGTGWVGSMSFIPGLALFAAGMYINIRSDNILIRLRSKGETGYRIPEGFLYRYISCPNHFGEIIEWAGFALMAWNLPALAFAIWTYANLVPRALSHHRWYRERFADYPKNRVAVFPFLL
ncbi:MAG: DUF1295 domain-containing protein [Chitinophagaceae bacterium]